ncbi:hypothetical protein D3C87_1643800 [compost metagenome]
MQVERDIGPHVPAHPHAPELGRQYPRVVDHEHVAGAQQGLEVGDVPVLERFAGPHHQQARAVARLGRVQGNQVLRQVEVEFGYTHVGSLAWGD